MTALVSEVVGAGKRLIIDCPIGSNNAAGILLQGFAAGSLGAVGIWRNWISSTVAVKWLAAIGIGEVGK